MKGLHKLVLYSLEKNVPFNISSENDHSYDGYLVVSVGKHRYYFTRFDEDSMLEAYISIRLSYETEEREKHRSERTHQG